MKKKLILVFSSIIFSLFLVEMVCRFIIFEKIDYDYRKTYRLFNQGKVFKNIENFFTYHPNQKIKSNTYYYKDGKFIKVYSYDIVTNNLGLVQKNNITFGETSILILGDSFTEGQGSSSWIDYFDGYYKNFQIINGGLLATGFMQFGLLENYLSNIINIKKVLVLFIGDDIRRDIYQINEQGLSCLENYKLCTLRELEGFYGFPLTKKNPEEFLHKLKKTRDVNKKNNLLTFKTFRRAIKSKLSNLYIFKIPIGFLRSNFYKSKNIKIKKNFEAIDQLITKYGENIYFVKLTMKDEIIAKKKSYETIYVEKHILSRTKNYYECNFNNDLSNFYVYDSHPNNKGYRNLFNCILKILEKIN